MTYRTQRSSLSSASSASSALQPADPSSAATPSEGRLRPAPGRLRRPASQLGARAVALTATLGAVALALGATACAGGSASDASFAGGTSSQGGSAMGASNDSSPASTGGSGSTGLSQAGAQDFGLFRQILADGGIPAPQTLDDLGFFAEHKIDFPAADCGHDVCVHGQLGVLGNMITGSNCTLVQIGMNTPIDVSEMDRPPLHLVLAVDTSGSMEGNAIEYVKAGLERMIDALEPTDRVSLVTYSTTATVVLEDVAATEELQLVEAFRAIHANGYTNLYAGMFDAFELARTYQDTSWQNRVVLLSDGVATVGIQETAKMRSLAAGYARSGIGITTIGLGDDFDIEVMRDLAEVGAGNFYFLEDAAAVQEVFTDEVKTFLWPVANDVVIDLQVGEGYRLGRVYGTHGFTGDETGGMIEIPSLFLAGRTDASAPIEEGRRGGGGSILVELIPLPDGESAADPYVVLDMDSGWSDPLSGLPLEASHSIRNTELPGVLVEGGLFDNPMVEKGFVMLNVFVAFQLAAELASDSDYPAARGILEALQPALEAWLADNPDPDIQDDLIYVDLFIDNLVEAESQLSVNFPPAPQPLEPWPSGD